MNQASYAVTGVVVQGVCALKYSAYQGAPWSPACNFWVSPDPGKAGEQVGED